VLPLQAFSGTETVKNRPFELRKRHNKALRLGEKSRSEKQEAEKTAKKHGWRSRWKKGNTSYELVSTRDNQILINKTFNSNAAISNGADIVRDFYPFMDGNDVIVGLWDAGAVLTTHQEFGSRVQVLDGASDHDHSTHVGGTIGAAGVKASAKGMAPDVYIDSYNWTDDLSEMTSAAMSYSGQNDKIQLSNQSYGYVAGWDDGTTPVRWYGTWGYRESEMFGKYDSSTSALDDLCYDSMYFLPFKATGNDRNNGVPETGETFEYNLGGSWYTQTFEPSTHPYADNYDDGGFDTITSRGVAKNVMTVGSVRDAVTGGVRDINKATMESYSCWGPADDGRIKPDIVANGYSLYSPTNSSDTSYSYKSGTSMACPSACGSAALLVEYWQELFGTSIKASTLKGLIIHTADDLGNAGPDYKFGWGLINTKAAADYIQDQNDDPNSTMIVEGEISSSNPNDVYTITSSSSDAIKVTLCWTDPAHGALGGLDNPTKCLVNNLDIRISPQGSATTYMPWILDKSNPDDPATTGGNDLDNVEQIYIETPGYAGNWTVTVSYSGTITYTSQPYSLIMTPDTLQIPPEAMGGDHETARGEAVDITLLATDDGKPDPPASLSYSIESLAEYGELSDPCDGGVLIDSVPYTLSADVVTYTPLPCYLGGDNFRFSADDGGVSPEGGGSNIADVNVESVLPAWMTFLSEEFGSEGTIGMNGELVTASVVCTGYSDITLEFEHYFADCEYSESDKCDVDVSISQEAWVNVVRFENESVTGTELVDISEFADDANDVRVRWRYYDGCYEWNWVIYDATITGRDWTDSYEGDLNFDCGVDFEDYALLSGVWGLDVNDPNFNVLYDISEPNDEVIDINDLAVFTSQWLKSSY
jgi:hypothetical protein